MRSYGKPSGASTPAAKFSVTTSEIAHDLVEQLAAALGAQVERDAELLDVVVLEPTAELDAATVVDERLHAAEDVPAAFGDGILDLDHLRAEGGEHPGGAGPGELAGEVTYPDV